MGDICNIGGTGMKIGDTLYCLDGSTVTLCYYDSEIIIVEYMGKRYKRPYSALGKKLFISPVNLGKVCSPSIYDQDGYDKDGFDRDGYNKKGYDRQGYPRPNMTVPKHVPYDQDGFDARGYDRMGYDRQGYDRYGYDKTDCAENRLFFKYSIHCFTRYCRRARHSSKYQGYYLG